jgi:hypothetical protein
MPFTLGIKCNATNKVQKTRNIGKTEQTINILKFFKIWYFEYFNYLTEVRDLERDFLARLRDRDLDPLRDFLRRWDRLRERERDLERERRDLDLDRERVRRDLDLDRDLERG